MINFEINEELRSEQTKTTKEYDLTKQINTEGNTVLPKRTKTTPGTIPAQYGINCQQHEP